MAEDSALLRRYVANRSEEAFAELVRRHVDLVYSVALRQVGGDVHLAQDVAQVVFTALARKASLLTGREVIAGWLYRSAQFAASDTVRGERRRRACEQAAQAMHEITAAGDPTPDLTKLRPLLDAAIGELGETDRDAICLRFFAQRSYADIGRQLRLSENSARMRVQRALDKLNALLARRGATSSAAALALALPGQAATAAPVGLAAALTYGALTANTGVAACGTILSIMNTTKLAVATSLLVSVLAVSTAFYVHRSSQTKLAAARDAQASAEQRAAGLEAQLKQHARFAAAADADASTLLAAVEAAAAQLESARKAGDEPITHESVQARYKHAQELDRAGRWDEALIEYLWCYDIGMVRIPSFMGVRRSYLLSSLMRLGEHLPAALEALRQRQTAAQNQFLASTTDLAALQDLAAINRELKEEARSMELYDSLAANDPRRTHLGLQLYDQLTVAQRYREAAQAKPYYHVSSAFEIFAGRTPSAATPEATEKLKKAQREMLIRQTATSVEVFAGAGELRHAADLALRLLDYDRTPETIALLEKHAARAGQPDLVAKLRAQ